MPFRISPLMQISDSRVVDLRHVEKLLGIEGRELRPRDDSRSRE